MAAQLHLHAIFLEDCMPPREHIITSHKEGQKVQDLIKVEYGMIEKVSPEYEGVEATASLQFASLYINCNRDTVSNTHDIGRLIII